MSMRMRMQCTSAACPACTSTPRAPRRVRPACAPRVPTACAPRQVTFETLLMVASQRKNQTVIEATGFAHQRREQALGNAQVTEQQVSAEMHAYGNISEALALDATAGLDYVWWDSLHALAASGAGKEFLVGVNPQVVLPVESH